MKKFIKIVVIIIALAIIGIQFVRPNRINPPIVENETLEVSTELPNDIETLMKRSCNDCHSNKTDFPWYSNISPISWKVVEHIDHGREEMNFSKWNTFSKERKLRKLEEICEQVKSGEMPHEQYLWIHWDAVLTDVDKKNLCDWTLIEAKKVNESE